MSVSEALPYTEEASMHMSAQDEQAELSMQSTEVLPVNEQPSDVQVAAQKLNGLVGRAAKTDSIDFDYKTLRTAEVTAGQLTTFVAELGLIAGTASVGAKGGDWLLLSIPVTLEMLRQGVVTTRASSRRQVEINNGYGLQPLRLPNPDSKGDSVAVAIHPRTYTEGTQEPATLTRERLADALDSVVLADNPKVKKVIIPGQVARRAGLPSGGTDYGRVVEEIVKKPVTSPYDDHETALVIPAELAAQISERLRQDPTSRAELIFGELGRRFPHAKDALRPENQAVRSALLNTLRRVSSVNDEKITTMQQDLTRGGITRRTDDTVTNVTLPADSFNPVMNTINVGTQSLVQSTNLRTMTATEREQFEAGQTTVDKVSDFALLQSALDILEQGDDQTEEETTPPETEMALGSTPNILTNGETDRSFARTRALQKVAGAVAVFGALAVTIPMIDLPNNDQYVPPPVSISELYRVHLSGMEPISAYWGQTTHEVYKDNLWAEGESDTTTIVELPQNLLDPNTPHITVETYSDEARLPLPIQDHMEIAALRVHDADGNDIPVETGVEADGETTLLLGKMAPEAYHLEYDLVPGQGSSFRATKPLSVEGNTDIDQRYLAPFGDSQASDAASFVASNFIYDNAGEIKTELAQTDTTAEYVQNVMDRGRCNCDQCNTAVALTQSVIHPEQKLEHVSGWYKPELEAVDYLGYVGHAWLISEEGIVDATASQFDSNSVSPASMSKESLDDAWQMSEEGLASQSKVKPDKPDEATQKTEDTNAPGKGNDEEKSPLSSGWLLGSALVAAGLLYERNTRRLRNFIGGKVSNELWTRSIAEQGTKDSLALLAWHEFGGSTPLPQAASFERAPAVKASNLSTQTLKEVAAGNFRGASELTSSQQRALRKTARSLIFDRNRSKR